jgi:uncharacterized protein (DUF427 family)
MPLVVKAKDSGTLLAQGRTDDESVRVFEGNWYFAPEAVDMAHLKVTERTYTCPYKGTCFWVDLVTPDKTVQNVAWVYNTPKPGYEMIKDRIAFYTRDTAGTVSVRE